jgi:hypothetical protein
VSLPEFEALAGRQTVAEFVAEYGSAEKDIRAGFALVKRGLEALGEGTSLYVQHYVDFDDIDEVATMLRRKAWSNIIDRLQMRRAMSVKSWEEFEKRMSTGECPPMTVEIVEGMVRQYRQDLPAMLEASVVEVFEWLRPHDSEYRTNSEYEIGKRVVMNGIVRRSYATWGTSSYYRQELIALENVFNLVAGKQPSERVNSCSNLETAINVIRLSSPCEGETEHFRFRGYKKGTLHLEFLHPEHVARLNAIAGGARLKPQPKETT